MKRAFITLAISAMLVAGLAGPASAAGALYKVNMCDVEVQKNKTVTETDYVYSGLYADIPQGDYFGPCAGYAIVTKPGNRYGHKK